MALRAPQYDGQQVRTTPLPDARMTTQASPEAMGGGLARGAQQVAQAAQRLYERRRQEADQIAAMNFDRQLGEFEVQRLYDPQAGALNMRGRDAFALPEQVMGDFDKLVGDLEKQAHTDGQRLALQRLAQARRQDIDRTVTRHVAREIDRYDDESTQAYVANARNSAALHYMDPDRVDLDLERIRITLYAHAQRRGIPPEAMKQQIEAATSSTHMAVISRMLADGHDELAEAYHLDHKDSLLADDAARAQRLVADGALRGRAQRQADEFIAESADRGEALEKARRLQDAKLRDEVTSRINTHYQQQRQIEAERNNQAFMAAAQVVEQTGKVDGIDPEAWIAMEPGQRQALEQRARQVARGVEPVTDWRLLTELIGSPESLAGKSAADIYRLRTKFDNAHYQQVLSIWQAATGAARGDQQAKMQQTRLRTFDRVVEDVLLLQGITREKDPKGYVRFRDAAEAQLENFELEELGGKRTATPMEVRRLVGELAAEQVSVPRSLFGIDRLWKDAAMPLAMVAEDDRGRVYVPWKDIPDDHRITIEEEIRSLGGRPTRDQVQRAYMQDLLGDRDTYMRIIREGTRHQQPAESDQPADTAAPVERVRYDRFGIPVY